MVTLTLVGGACDGRSVEVDPRDATRTLMAAPYGDGAVALNATTVMDSAVMRAAKDRWQLYERDAEDELRYRYAPDEPFSAGASN
jgi:hypothetical protein